MIETTKRRGQLVKKYAVVFVVLVGGALLTSGLIELYFSYRESSAALAQIQQEKANGAASRIELFLADVERQITAVAQTPILPGSSVMEERRNEYVRLLRRAPAITEAAYLSPTGRPPEPPSSCTARTHSGSRPGRSRSCRLSLRGNGDRSSSRRRSR